jgi:hypothetical protein
MPGSVNDEKQWRTRAAEARAHAAQMKDDASRATLLRIAVAYDSLADRARENATRNPE